MKKFLSLTLVLSFALLATQSAAQMVSVTDDVTFTSEGGASEGVQVVFGGRRQGRSGPQRTTHCNDDDIFGIKQVNYPHELKNHALVRFNARKHHDITFPVPAGFSQETVSTLSSSTTQEQDDEPMETMLQHLDVWSRSRASDEVLAHFTASQFERFERAMYLKGIPEGGDDWQVIERDLQRVADEDAESIYRASLLVLAEQEISAWKNKDKNKDKKKKRVDFDTWFKNYHPHDEIKDFYLQIADDYPDLVTYIPSIGQTVEGRDIFAIRLTAKEHDGSVKEKPQIWWQGLQHAREWAGGSTVQFLTHHLTSHYGKNDNITAILRDTEFVIVPIMNIDGYDYTWNNNRLWRKNRRQNSFGAYGVDLNRNWDDHFGQGGSSGFPWSETYHGPSAASEPEVQALQNFFSEQKRIVGAIDFHCYSQLVLRPQGWTTQLSPHEKELKFVGDRIASIIKDVHGKKYISEPSVALYKTTGAASDWFYGDKATAANNGHHVYSYTIELRPSSTNPGGRSGFILPPEEIIPLGEEIAQAMEFFVDYVVKNPLKN
ncbi:hypothetical protein BGZ97_005382 [Linnemannia gamsii]|uniref:Peptidase M14 domain-containing protein n=1 Tax=Linnemannia gamsii TaxID=64522 RepID=A0A9P6RFE2_9FUNG|nr:hypothetical protein BGZ97_005382 [Linnemannia gamsii]